MLPPERSVELCKLMLEEVLKVVSSSKKIDDTLLVSHDQSAFDIGKKFDVIIAQNVLAHVSSPKEFLDSIGECLKDDGIAAIQTSQYYMFKNFEFDTIYHEHFCYLSLNVVIRICSLSKLYVYDVEELPTHGGSLRVWLSKKKLPATYSLKKVLEQEEQYGLENISTYEGFQEKAMRVKKEIREFLLNEKKAGRKVLGYGAAAKGNTLLNFLSLNG